MAWYGVILVNLTNSALPRKGEHQSKRNNMKLGRRKLRRNMAVKLMRRKQRRRGMAGVCKLIGG